MAEFPASLLPAAAVPLADAASIVIDASAGRLFEVTIAGDRTLAPPVNGAANPLVTLAVTQGAGGSFTLTYSTAFEFSSGLPEPTLSTDAGTTDYLGFVWSAVAGKWRLLSFQGGF